MVVGRERRGEYKIMGRYTEAKCRLCRREGIKLFLKGVRCNTEKCSFAKRPTPPGMHAHTRSKPSYYCLQLREKQKVKRMYGMFEKQFRRFFGIATKSKGITGKVLIQLLERRLDNILYRSLLALSRNQARQIVTHGFVFTKGRRVDIPSYIVKVGETFEIKCDDKMKAMINDNLEVNSKERSVPEWLVVDKVNFAIKINKLPEKDNLAIPVNEQLIVELYSK